VPVGAILSRRTSLLLLGVAGFGYFSHLTSPLLIANASTDSGEPHQRPIMSGMIHTMVIGVCEYRLNTEEKDVIDARWISSDAVEKGTICRGRATGDTSNGFPGNYHIQYFGTEDELVGDLDLQIEPVGDAYRLIWRNRSDDVSAPGEIAFEGFGFPTGDQSMVLTYWMAE
jgi:hypothetical protein